MLGRVSLSKAFALTWYRVLTWFFLRLSSPCTHVDPWKAVSTRGGLPCCPVTSSGTSGPSNGRAGEQYQVKARYQVRANALLLRLGFLRRRASPSRPSPSLRSHPSPRLSRILPLRIQHVWRCVPSLGGAPLGGGRIHHASPRAQEAIHPRGVDAHA